MPDLTKRLGKDEIKPGLKIVIAPHQGHLTSEAAEARIIDPTTLLESWQPPNGIAAIVGLTAVKVRCSDAMMTTFSDGLLHRWWFMTSTPACSNLLKNARFEHYATYGDGFKHIAHRSHRNQLTTSRRYGPKSTPQYG
mmetsp:Transcript_16820/g.23950  ORF Transcript_16820/g.23950 Transcript_16820/m.23950 type:complete len:138 (+) Transcript_16820:377-790(+)